MKITFTGANSQIGKYIKGQYDTTSYDLFDEKTWPALLESDVLFLLLPKDKKTLDKTKKFVLSAMNSNIKHIIKIGSLGPWRLIHTQLNSFLLESRIPYTSFNIAPLMNNIFTEQYDSDNKIFYDYRNNAPAPYLDPACLAKAIEESMGKEIHFNKSYSCTGNTQYTTKEVVEILKAKNYDVQKTQHITSSTILPTDIKLRAGIHKYQPIFRLCLMLTADRSNNSSTKTVVFLDRSSPMITVCNSG